MKIMKIKMRITSLLLFLVLTWLDTVVALPKWLAKLTLQNKEQQEQDAEAGVIVEPEEAPPPSPLATLLESLLSLPWYIWWIMFILAGTLGMALYFARSIGALDRPSFVVRDSVVWSSTDPYWQKHKRSTEYLYAIVALSHEREFGKTIQRLLPATSAAVGAAIPATAPTTAAARYGAPQGADSLSVALYFDDPNMVPQPRWALGWLVAADNFHQAKIWAAVAQREWKEDEPLVAIRLGAGQVLQARIPWRHVLTPALAPFLHWKRGVAAYHRLYPDRPWPVCAEFYVTGPNQSREWMDYIMFCNDIAHTWQDCGFE